jgi:hypothetical protein
MRFYPNTTLVFIIFIACLLAGIGLAYLCFQQKKLLPLLGSVAMLSIALFFLFPVIKNQTVDLIDKGLVISSFGTAVILDVNDLYQVVKRRDGALSYRFERGDFNCQVTPYAYHEGKILQEHFNQKFKLDELTVEVIEEG